MSAHLESWRHSILEAGDDNGILAQGARLLAAYKACGRPGNPVVLVELPEIAALPAETAVIVWRPLEWTGQDRVLISEFVKECVKEGNTPIEWFDCLIAYCVGATDIAFRPYTLSLLREYTGDTK